MKTIVCILLILSASLQAQEIEIGTVFTIEFKNPEKNMDFTIVSRMPYNEIIDVSKSDAILNKNELKDNQVIGVFAKGNFGNETNPMLILISGVDGSLNYELKMKIPGKGKFKNTSTSPLHKDIKSVEYWPYPIEKINFKKFKLVQNKNLRPFHFEAKVDSTCLKDANRNIASGEKEFKSHLKSIIKQFESNDKFLFEKSLAYEKSISAEDVSLGHFWSLGKTLYPNSKGFEFGDPVSYRRVECPYFEGSTNYFYTKDINEVKVLEFEWKTFEESNLGSNPEIEGDLNQKFIEKYDFVVNFVSELLGKPLNIPQEKDSGRIDTHWKSATGITGYLFRFTEYNEIRLFIYKE